ncbi:hypothetical protein FRB90_010868 [Tulasnella sp. 427]|nr:hypothetical protein FRB90_010868 [Tulasnella sp. 427]
MLLLAGTRRKHPTEDPTANEDTKQPDRALPFVRAEFVASSGGIVRPMTLLKSLADGFTSRVELVLPGFHGCSLRGRRRRRLRRYFYYRGVHDGGARWVSRSSEVRIKPRDGVDFR